MVFTGAITFTVPMFFKPPWLSKMSPSPKEVRRDKAADIFYKACIGLSAALFGWLGFWLNIHEIMAKCHPSLAIPTAILFASMITIFSGIFGESLSRCGKYISGSVLLVFFLVATNPVRMITYEKKTESTNAPSLQIEITSHSTTALKHPQN